MRLPLSLTARVLCCVALALAFAVALRAQSAPETFYAVSSGTTTLFTVRATSAVTVDAERVIELWDCKHDPYTPVAVLPIGSGLTLTPNGDITNCPRHPAKHPSDTNQPVRNWLALYNGTRYARISGNSVDAKSMLGSMLIYNDPLQTSALVALPGGAGASVFPVAVVREDSYCAAAVSCFAPAAPHLETHPPVPEAGTWHEARPHHIEPKWQRVEPVPASPQSPYFCKSTKPSYPDGYPLLPAVSPQPTGLAEYYGPLITWTPNDNAQECHIRQLYFWVPTVYGDATNGAGPDIRVYMTRHGETKVSREPIAWDIVAIPYADATLYRIDAQQIPAKPDKKGLQGDYDFYIDVVGTPAH